MVWYNVNDIMRKTENTEPKCKLLTPLIERPKTCIICLEMHYDMDPKKDYVNTKLSINQYGNEVMLKLIIL